MKTPGDHSNPRLEAPIIRAAPLNSTRGKATWRGPAGAAANCRQQWPPGNDFSATVDLYRIKISNQIPCCDVITVTPSLAHGEVHEATPAAMPGWFRATTARYRHNQNASL
jgi:hypothetical protein